jgi:Mrp family chromosome partitioning ATPase
MRRQASSPAHAVGTTYSFRRESTSQVGDSDELHSNRVPSLAPRRTGDARLIVSPDADSPAAAAFRVLQYKLRCAGDPRVIVVSSARSGDGKTTCAANLALAIAESGANRVLLAEVGQGAPQLPYLFGFDAPDAMETWLMGAARGLALSGWVVHLETVGLHVAAMDAGREGGMPVHAPTFAAAMQWLRGQGYDYIVVDATPVLGGVTVNLLQEGADGTLLVTRAGHSRGRDLRAAVEQLVSGPVLGVVFLET